MEVSKKEDITRTFARAGQLTTYSPGEYCMTSGSSFTLRLAYFYPDPEETIPYLNQWMLPRDLEALLLQYKAKHGNARLKRLKYKGIKGIGIFI